MPDALHAVDMPPETDATAWVVRLAVRFGVGIGLAYAAWLLGLHLVGDNAFGPHRQLVHFAIPAAVVASQWTLQRVLRPEKPGLGRSLAVGILTAVIAATMAATSLYGLGAGIGESAIIRSRAELLEIARTQKTFLIKQLGGEVGYQKNLDQVAHLTVGDLAMDDFIKILILGVVLAIPAGVFLRE